MSKGLSWEQLTPTGDKLLIRRLPEDQTKKLESGIELALPDKQANKNLWVEILKVGKGFFAGGKFHRRPVKPGDIVCIRQFEDMNIVNIGERYAIVDGYGVDLVALDKTE